MSWEDADAARHAANEAQAEADALRVKADEAEAKAFKSEGHRPEGADAPAAPADADEPEDGKK